MTRTVVDAGRRPVLHKDYLMQTTNPGTNPSIGFDAASSVEVDGSTANTPIPSPQTPRPARAALLFPKQPPPRVLKRYELDNPPADGTAISVTVKEGNRTVTYQGRVLFITDGRLRLKEGAGWWDIMLRDVLTITAL